MTKATIPHVSVPPLTLSWREWSNLVPRYHSEMAAPVSLASYNEPRLVPQAPAPSAI